jgi:prepilin-type N-terminal cleavage/methylation domain-containing protein
MGMSKGIAGYTMVEMVVVVGIIGIMAGIAIPFFNKMFRRNRVRSAVQEVYSLVLATRMQAAKRNQPVVLQILINNPAKCPETKQCAVMWVDANRNFVQDAGELTLQRQIIPDYVFFRYPGGAVNGANAICFDKYLNDATLKDMVVFLGDGTLALPQAANSAAPTKPLAFTATIPSGSINCTSNPCRGIYMTDQPGRDANVFRISVDDFGRTGRASLLKRLSGITYVPGPTWQWQD